jgi:hypothetical protein
VTRRKLGYADVWEDYVAAGWTPVPLPRGRKKTPPRGTTGDTDYRFIPFRHNYREWADEFPRGNVALVMPESVIGLDVDVYHDGDMTLARLVREHGELPTTWESTSRAGEDWSGIKLFRVPEGTKLVREIETGIELLQWWHRYCVAWPSIHPEGRMYEWWIGGTAVGIPKVSELPDLPPAWLKGLADNRTKASSRNNGYDGDVDDWLDAHTAEWTPARARRVLREAERAFGGGACRHATMCSAQAALIRIGAAGKPVQAALDELEGMFYAALYGERDAESEFREALETAVRKFGGRKTRRRYPGLSDADLAAAASRIAGRLS